MSLSTLELSETPIPGKRVLLCIPGTYCSPVIFDLLDKNAFPDLQIISLSWMTSPGPWDIESLGHRVAGLLLAYNLKSTLLVGHSSGGAIAMVAALTEPTLIDGLLLIDTGANTLGHGDIDPIIKVIEQGASQQLFQPLFQRSFHYPPARELMQQLFSYAEKVPPEAALAALKSQAKLDLVPALKGISAPVIILHGRHDQARPLEHAELLLKHLPHAELLLADSGHTPIVEAPATYEEALQRLCTLTKKRPKSI